MKAAVEPILHDGDELLVAQLPVPVLVEDLEDDVHQVPAQRLARADLHRPLKLICAIERKQAGNMTENF